MFRLLAAPLVAVCFSSPCWAGYMDGNKLKVKLDEVSKIAEGRSDAVSESAFVHGYVAAIHDTNVSVAFCPPSSVTLGQEIAIVQKYLRDNPADWAMSGDTIVVFALSQAFPCNKKK